MGLVIDSRFYTHPRTLDAGLSAAGLWVSAGCWLAQFPKQGEIVMKGIVTQHRAGRQAEALIRAGLWTRARNSQYRMLRYVSPFDGMPVDKRPLWSVIRDDYRRAISQALRDRIYERDEYRCTACGATEHLSLDHIHPWSLGGADTEDNLRVLCRSCNSSKGAQVLCPG